MAEVIKTATAIEKRFTGISFRLEFSYMKSVEASAIGQLQSACLFLKANIINECEVCSESLLNLFFYIFFSNYISCHISCSFLQVL